MVITRIELNNQGNITSIHFGDGCSPDEVVKFLAKYKLGGMSPSHVDVNFTSTIMERGVPNYMQNAMLTVARGISTDGQILGDAR